MFIDIIEHKRAEEERKQNSDRLIKAVEATITAIAQTVEMRDVYTAGHQRRVTQLASAIASEMDLLEERIEGLRLASIVYDIGKIQIPAEIMSKPSSLSELEFGMIKIHPVSGSQLLKSIESPWPIAQIVLQHHERMDGSGYPSGLRGVTFWKQEY